MLPEVPDTQRIPLSRSQQNIYNGVSAHDDPQLHLIGRCYRFRPLAQTEFLAALRKTILATPIQLCVLEAPSEPGGHPGLVARLDIDDIVQLCGDEDRAALTEEWESGILAKPLVRYTVYVDAGGQVCGLDAQAHHILLDGGAISVIEAHLGRFLVGGGSGETPCAHDGLAAVATAHRREAYRVDESLERLTSVVQKELTAAAEEGGHGHPAADAQPTVARGTLIESAVILGEDYEQIVDLAGRENVPLNVLVAAAALAVDASIHRTTERLLVHAVDNRFGDPDLGAATCLVNSMAQPVRFLPYASVAEVVRGVDRGYVKAGRRRWLREERYRRMYLAINRTTSVQTLTLNFLREPCASELAPFLDEAPVTSNIGPVEGTTVAAVLDGQRRTLTVNIWNRPDLSRQNSTGMAGRVAGALKSMASMWDSPIAMTVGEWCAITDDGALGAVPVERDPEDLVARAWFVDRPESVAQCRRRPHVDSWIAWLVESNVAPGDVVVFTDDGSDKTIALLIACHLAGCGYSVCDRDDQVSVRAQRINEPDNGISVHTVDVESANIPRSLGAHHRRLVDVRVEQTVTDPQLRGRTAYVMPTSGSTGEPKLVHVTHGSLAAFCVGMVRAYGWGPDDTVLQCAPLTSDISVEEVFGAVVSGAALTRSTAVKSGDLQALAGDLVASGATVVDLPTAVWHLWCEDVDAVTRVGRSQVRQIVIGGEPVRPGAVDKWADIVGTENISLVSSYGPTETTVVVTYLPIIDRGRVVEHGARLRLGRPLVPNTVVIAFGEVVVVGDMVSDGYLDADSTGFGLVTTADGRRQRVFATADRVTLDGAGHPIFAGRKDAIVKIAGKRVDTAAITRRVAADPAVVDVAVELHNGGLGVWFETQRTRGGHEDLDTAARISNVLVDSRVPSFVVSGVANIPRKPNGKTDTARLTTSLGSGPGQRTGLGGEDRAVGLAGMWSTHLGRVITPATSLLHEGIGSLDLVRILPDTRRYLGRQVSILDLIGADTAANLVDDVATSDGWMDNSTAAEIERDVSVLTTPSPRAAVNPKRPLATRDAGPILVVGASGVLGSGFAEAILTGDGAQRPDVVLAMRSVPPVDPVWTELRNTPGVRIERLVPGFGPVELSALIRETGARTLVNCIGNTNVVVPYREIRSANVEMVAAMAQACAASGTRMVHLSTYVVSGDVTAPEVVDPRQAPYPYAAAKALGELVVCRADRELDFTVVRLPRVLGTPEQLRRSADILVSIVDACRALNCCPAVELTEEVTIGRAAADSILRRLPEFGGPGELGCGIEVLRGRTVTYEEVLGAVADNRVGIEDWKRRLDESDWAKANARRWSVIDAWIGLGRRLGGRSYAEYLAEFPVLPLPVRAVGELVAPPPSLPALICPEQAGTGCARTTTNQQDSTRQ
ncbi:AMP-binding protein [Mycobacterium syngnathidarum]